MVVRDIPQNPSWDYGVTLDKHMEHSTYIGDDEYGNPQFNNVRTEVGEAVFQLKYRSDFGQVEFLAQRIVQVVEAQFPEINVVVPMPASKARDRQPVHEVAARVAHLLSADYVPDLLVKHRSTGLMKNLNTYEEKVEALEGCFACQDQLIPGEWNVLLVDDLYDTGASLEAACTALRGYRNIGTVCVAAMTRRR